MTDNLEKKVINQIKKYSMISAGENIIVGVSGGKDSVALLHFLHDYSKTIKFNLCAVHVNHMLRGLESERDKMFTQEACKTLNVPCLTMDLDIKKIARENGLGIEEAGRYARHRAFEDAAEIKNFFNDGVIKVALAHHGDDNAETVLLNLVRGAGLNGLKGISPIARNGRLVIIRPFLCVGRDSIYDYIRKNEISYIDDSSNFCDDYARNKIRLNVMPEFRKVNSRALDHINDAAETLRMLQEFLECQIEKGFKDVTYKNKDSVIISIPGLIQYNSIIQAGIIQKSIKLVAETMKDITRVHISDILGLAEKQTGSRIDLPYNMRACRNYEQIVIKKNHLTDEGQERDSIILSVDEIDLIGKDIQLNDEKILHFQIVKVDDANRKSLIGKNKFTKAFDCDTIKGHLIFESAKPSDVITIVGGKKTLKRFFTDEKVPYDERRNVMVLKDAESTLWIVGYRIGEAYKITESTTRALKVDIIGGNDE